LTASTEQKNPVASDWRVGDRAIIREKDHVEAGQEGVVIEVKPSPLPFPLVLKYEDKAGKEQEELFARADLEPVEAEVISFSTQTEMVEHPPHYGGKDDPYEVIKVAEAWGLDKDAYLFNVLKYIARCGKKDDELQELRKGHFYLGRKITNVLKERGLSK
jgi:Protein of unknwon function (DUF3310)